MHPIKPPSIEDYWRGVILYGRNVQSYKFALASALLDLQPADGDLVKLEDLAPVYAGYLARHLEQCDKQGTARSSKFLDTCRGYLRGDIDQAALVEQTVRLGFNNVIDAFHVVGSSSIEHPFFIDERKTAGGIRVTEAFSRLQERPHFASLPAEVEARWRLVETAWELNVARAAVAVDYDAETERLFTKDGRLRRKAITSCRDALNGYQKGQCFYCPRSIDLTARDDTAPDVDHFIPHLLKPQLPDTNLDGVWNLVLACQTCNRGPQGKFAQLPVPRLLERLHTRNEYLIGSNHPLKETLIAQTGRSPRERAAFLTDVYERAWSQLLVRWEPPEDDDPQF
jgi:5-methylcytosine-specific restriction endonuclease McrA